MTHVAINLQRYVVATCSDDAPEIGQFISSHTFNGNKVFRVTNKEAESILYTTVSSDWLSHHQFEK